VPGWNCPWRTLRFFLPRGFWSYTLSLEQQSAINFFSQRLDLILVLNFGGLKLLGSYVAIVVLGDVIRVAGRAFLDTLLPSLTNLLARRNLLAASQVLSLNLRILFLIYMAATCGLMFLAGPITGVLGARYVSLRVPFLLMALFFGLAAPGAVGGILLSSVGKQQRAVWIALGQVGLFTTLFLSLWPRWQLLGAVLATGISLLLANLVLLAVAKYSTPIRFPVGGDYAKFILVGSVAALAAMRSLPFGLAGDLLAWAGTVGVFLVWARYRSEELGQILHYFLPGSWGAGASEIGGASESPEPAQPALPNAVHAQSHGSAQFSPGRERGPAGDGYFHQTLAGIRVRLRHQGLWGLLSDVVRSFSTVYEVWQCDLTSAAPTLQQSATAQIRVGPDAAMELERSRQNNMRLPLAFYRDLADDVGACAFLALIEGQMAGIAWGFDRNRPLSSLRMGPGDVEICDVYTLDQFRGRGVAKALLCEACRCYRDRGFARVYATIRSDNTPSLRAFQAAGFKKVGKVSGRKLFGSRFVTVDKLEPRAG
jgi:ribosomal protein S18 acetylase RimI-like enzyme